MAPINTTITIRDAAAEDMEEVHTMAADLISYQKLPYEPIDKEVFLKQSGFFPPNTIPYFHVYVAEATDASGNKTLAGYSLDYFFVKLTNKGHTLFIEDLFVKEPFRGQSVGHMLLKQNAIRTKKHNGYSMKLECLDWNPAKKFYERHGGKWDGIKTRPDAITYEYDKQAIDSLVNGN
jgi:GNAT superfamily N-acetyltransferase